MVFFIVNFDIQINERRQYRGLLSLRLRGGRGGR